MIVEETSASLPTKRLQRSVRPSPSRHDFKRSEISPNLSYARQSRLRILRVAGCQSVVVGVNLSTDPRGSMRRLSGPQSATRSGTLNQNHRPPHTEARHPEPELRAPKHDLNRSGA